MHPYLKAMACAAALLPIGTAQAQGTDNYPSRPVTLVTPFAAGGPTDIEGRLYANELGKALGQQFVMDFKPGGVMAVGMNYAVRQKPDGYTLVWVSSSYSLLPLLRKDRNYDPVKDFDTVTMMSKRSSVLLVANEIPARNIAELVTCAKANPNKLNWVTAGVGGIHHLTGLWFASATNTQLTFIHYKSGSAAYPDLMSGRAHVMPGTFTAEYPMARAGKARLIAIASLQRNPSVPDVPTATEQGIPGFEYSSWMGMVAPVRTPVAIINRLNTELQRIVKLPEIREKLGTDTLLLGLGPAEFRKAASTETARWQKLVSENNIKLEDD